MVVGIRSLYLVFQWFHGLLAWWDLKLSGSIKNHRFLITWNFYEISAAIRIFPLELTVLICSRNSIAFSFRDIFFEIHHTITYKSQTYLLLNGKCYFLPLVWLKTIIFAYWQYFWVKNRSNLLLASFQLIHHFF